MTKRFACKCSWCGALCGIVYISEFIGIEKMGNISAFKCTTCCIQQNDAEPVIC